MATSESRSPFRLPWSSDRSHEGPDRFATAEDAPGAATYETAPDEAPWADANDATQPGDPPAGPQALDHLAAASESRPGATWGAPGGGAPGPADPVPAPAPPRKPTKLMVDLATAIRATSEAARDGALAAVDVDATEVTGAIRAASTVGAETLRRRSDEDLTGIKDWSKAEIARIREETEARIGARKAMLENELAAYAAAVEHRIGEVNAAVAQYRAAMAVYFDALTREEDPSRLASMAEAMPEPLALESWKDIADLDLTAFAAVPEASVEAAVPEAAVTLPEAGVALPEAAVEAAEPEGTVEAFVPDAAPEVAPEAAVETAEPEAVAPEAAVEALTPGTAEPEAVAPETFDPEAAGGTAETAETARIGRTNPWGAPDDAWAGAEARAAVWAGRGAESGQDEITSRSFGPIADAPASEAQSDTADRDAVLAALEEAAAEPVGDGSADEAVMGAPEDAGGFDSQSFTDRLARLLPSQPDVADGEPVKTQVVVTGLVSVASIASFKRHLGRLNGVGAVGVASGPGGEFVFHVTHRPDVSFRDAIPSMPGFAARVTGTADGVVSVTARDPEAEG